MVTTKKEIYKHIDFRLLQEKIRQHILKNEFLQVCMYGYIQKVYIYIGVYLYNARDQKVQGREATLVGENLSTKKPSTPA